MLLRSLAGFTLDQKLDELMTLIKSGNVDSFRQLSAILTDSELNAQHSVSGRTLFHEVCLYQQHAMIRILRSRKVNERIRDKNGFFPIELAVGLIREFNQTLEAKEKKEKNYREFLIVKANQHLREFKNPAVVVLISDVSEINVYIEQHPRTMRIGFVLKKPNCLRQKDDMHVVPLYFERNHNEEIFIQLDSALGQHYLIPASRNAAVKRYHYYSPFRRQASGVGCFEDAVSILIKLLKSAGFLQFCKQHSVQLSKDIFVPLSEFEQYENNKLCDRQKKLLADTERKRLLALQHRNNNFAQRTVFAYFKIDYSEIEPIFKLTSLPSTLIPHIERWDTMRHFRVNEKERVAKVLDTLLEKGAKKKKSKATDAEIKQHLTDPDKRYDIRGRSFKKRHEYLLRFYTNRPKAKNALSTRLQTQLFAHDEKLQKHEQRKKLEKKEAETIASKVMGFVFGNN
jgi:hypothetical protein